MSSNSDYTRMNNGESIVSSLSGYNVIMTDYSHRTRDNRLCIKGDLKISLDTFGEDPIRKVFLEYNQNLAKFSSPRFNDVKWSQE